ncbi:hypothetical protein K9F62_10080 [Desulfovibrio sp. JY]|nr:hypothetical protein K9F62_10080 [Desulfovibrio sp. JY]
MTHKRLPNLEPPIGYDDLEQRLFEVRDRIYEAYDRDELVKPAFDLSEQFWSNTALREATAEVLLGCIVWTEAGRSSAELLRDCLPEIRELQVYALNSLLKYTQLKAHTQKGVILSRGSLVDAWIHLLVEFREALVRESDHWIWRVQQPDYVPDNFFD